MSSSQPDFSHYLYGATSFNAFVPFFDFDGTFDVDPAWTTPPVGPTYNDTGFSLVGNLFSPLDDLTGSTEYANDRIEEDPEQSMIPKGGESSVTAVPIPNNNVKGPYRVSKRRSSRRQSSSLHRPSNSTATIHPDPTRVIIGLLVSNHDGTDERYECPFPSCTAVTFGRPAELKRHHASCHKGFGSKTPQYWCPISGCERSKSGGGGSFPRRDKMMDHLERVHRDEVGGE